MILLFLGPAFYVGFPTNRKNQIVGKFVITNGTKGDFVAGYKVFVKKTGIYKLWIDAFARTSDNNGIIVQIADNKKHNTECIFNRENALWLPAIVSHQFIQNDVCCCIKLLL